MYVDPCIIFTSTKKKVLPYNVYVNLGSIFTSDI